MHEFVEEIAVLNRWLGHDIPADPRAAVPSVSAFRFRDTAVFQVDAPDCWGRMFLVRGDRVRDFVPSEVSIDQAYGELDRAGELPAVA